MCESEGNTSRVLFENDAMEDKEQVKGDQYLHCTFKRWKKSISFDILNDISEYVTLVQLLYTNENVSNTVSIDRDWIFGFN